MYPPADPVVITEFWTEEDIFKMLEKLKSGFPLPANVTADVNPYQFNPSNLPEGTWYFCSEVNKKAQHGFWKPTGEACNIYSNSATTGWRATLKYYQGLASHGQITNWVMQEYWITKRELRYNSSNPKVFDSLCRVFMSDENPGLELPPKHDHADISNKNPINCVPTTAPNAAGKLSKGESVENNVFNETPCRTIAERSPHHPLENLADYILNEDYLELNDLADPDSDSSCSVNSSFRTFNSDEYFDSLALLQELDAENKEENKNCASFKFIHSSTIKPKDVVMLPAIVGKLGCVSSDSGSKSPTKGDYMKEGTSDSPNKVAVAVAVAASSPSSSDGSFKDEKKGLVGKMKKLKNKYLCFITP